MNKIPDFNSPFIWHFLPLMGCNLSLIYLYFIHVCQACLYQSCLYPSNKLSSISSPQTFSQTLLFVLILSSISSVWFFHFSAQTPLLKWTQQHSTMEHRGQPRPNQSILEYESSTAADQPGQERSRHIILHVAASAGCELLCSHQTCRILTSNSSAFQSSLNENKFIYACMPIPIFAAFIKYQNL